MASVTRIIPGRPEEIQDRRNYPTSPKASGFRAFSSVLNLLFPETAPTPRYPRDQWVHVKRAREASPISAVRHMVWDINGNHPSESSHSLTQYQVENVPGTLSFCS
jgi:hypothetical protein